MMRIKPVCVRLGVYYVSGKVIMLPTIDATWLGWANGHATSIPIPIHELFFGEYIIEEYVDMVDALVVLKHYHDCNLNVEIRAGRFVCVSICPMYT